jgi:membrane associated rhomboid family serine protease
MSDEQIPEKRRTVAPKRLSNIVTTLVAANLIVYAAQYYFIAFLDINLFDKLAIYNYRSDNFAIYQFVTHMFLHAGFLHIFLNMFILWIFGSALEYVWQSKRFIFYYFFTGIGAALLHLGVSSFAISQLEDTVSQYKDNPSYTAYTQFIEDEVGIIPELVPTQAKVLTEMKELEEKWAEEPQNEEYRQQSTYLVQGYYEFYVDRPSLGASGAVFGILLAFGMLFPNNYVYIFFIFPMKAKYFVIFLGFLEFYFGIMEQNNVANFAHLGGMIFGFILIKFWGEKPRDGLFGG